MSVQAASADRQHILTGWVRIVFGLLIFAFGVHLTIYANIGLAPWDCLGMGIAKTAKLLTEKKNRIITEHLPKTAGAFLMP